MKDSAEGEILPLRVCFYSQPHLLLVARWLPYLKHHDNIPKALLELSTVRLNFGNSQALCLPQVLNSQKRTSDWPCLG